MNRKQLTLLIVVGLVLGGLAWYASFSRQKEYDQRDAGIGEKLEVHEMDEHAILAAMMELRERAGSLKKVAR